MLPNHVPFQQDCGVANVFSSWNVWPASHSSSCFLEDTYFIVFVDANESVLLELRFKHLGNRFLSSLVSWAFTHALYPSCRCGWLCDSAVCCVHTEGWPAAEVKLRGGEQAEVTEQEERGDRRVWGSAGGPRDKARAERTGAGPGSRPFVTIYERQLHQATRSFLVSVLVSEEPTVYWGDRHIINLHNIIIKVSFIMPEVSFCVQREIFKEY